MSSESARTISFRRGRAAFSSALSFTVGAALPLAAILLSPADWRIPITAIAVILALVVTGTVSAQLGAAPKGRAVLRLVVGGTLALVATSAIGSLIGTATG